MLKLLYFVADVRCVYIMAAPTVYFVAGIVGAVASSS